MLGGIHTGEACHDPRALEQAVAAHRPGAGLMHHSDHGSQDCSREYQALLRGQKMRVSMSRKGNGYDNAPVESFGGTWKTESAHQRRYRTRLEAAREIADYNGLFDKRQRRQARRLVSGGLHATVHAARESDMNVTHGVRF